MLITTILKVILTFACKDCSYPPIRTVNVQMIYVKGANALSPQYRREMLRGAKKILRHQQIEVKFTSTRTISDKDQCEVERHVTGTEVSPYISFYCYWKYRSHKKYTISMLVAPPLVNTEGKFGVGGVAEAICGGLGTIAVAYATDPTAERPARVKLGSIVIAHEIGHLLGASHTNVNNHQSVMHPAALGYYANPLHFINSSLREIRLCSTSYYWRYNRSQGYLGKLELQDGF